MCIIYTFVHYLRPYTRNTHIDSVAISSVCPHTSLNKKKLAMLLKQWKYSVIVALIALEITIYIYSRDTSQPSKLEEEARLQQAHSQLRKLRQRHRQLMSRIIRSPRLRELIDAESKDLFQNDLGPDQEYEMIRRRVYSNTKELWNYVQHQLKPKSAGDLTPDKIKIILEEVAHRKRWLLSDVERLPQVDGHEAWRRAEAGAVSKLVQRRLLRLQHPPDCRRQRKLLCVRLKEGFGWQFHNLAQCLNNAYATKRTLIMYNDTTWVYNRGEGWRSTFEALSQTCSTWYNGSFVVKPLYSNVKVLLKKSVHNIEFRAFYIPKDLVHKITQFNGDPTSWWIGQLYKYIFKLRPKQKMKLDLQIQEMDFKTPIVGIHVRRSDKLIWEAKYHDLAEYMSHVEDHYLQLELTRNVRERSVYVATDDAKVLDEAMKNYPQYNFYGDRSRAQSANPENRYSRFSLNDLLIDLHMLVMCDFVVLTLSSNFGRMVYNLRQTKRDASTSIVSLDDVYYFSHTDPNYRIAVMNHEGKKFHEISFRVGNIIDARINYWNGTGRGTRIMKKIEGLFPWYKTNKYIASYPYPEYEEVPIYQPPHNEGYE